MEEKGSFIRWIREHKTQLIIAGFSIVTLIAIVLGIKKRDEIKAFWDSLRETTEPPVIYEAKVPKLEPVKHTVEDVANVGVPLGENKSV